ncbi:MAG: PQQ-binding-like beta-propeller repeat protein, partial [Methanoregula sp.]|nr:PQQ-binding-like beta-propeller repeat protein [Methanoregula sp.]
MRTVFQIVAVVAAVFFASCIFGTVTAASIVPAWKVNLPDDMRVSGITISDDGSRVFVSGNLLMVLSGDGRLLWSGYSGGVGVAAMSGNGKYVVTAMGADLRLLDKDGALIWTRTSGAPITNVAISNTGSVIVSDDSRGYLRTFNAAGESFGTARLEPAKNIAISPAGDLIVIATDSGLRYINPGLDLLWSDNRSGGLETFIAISIDGSTIYTAGGNRVSSHTRNGALNWQKDVTSEHITDMA